MVTVSEIGKLINGSTMSNFILKELHREVRGHFKGQCYSKPPSESEHQKKVWLSCMRDQIEQKSNFNFVNCLQISMTTKVNMKSQYRFLILKLTTIHIFLLFIKNRV